MEQSGGEALLQTWIAQGVGELMVWVRGSVFILMFRGWAGLPQPAPHCVPRLGEALRAHTKPIKCLIG